MSRRSFVAGAAGAALVHGRLPGITGTAMKAGAAPGSVLLFQGDSITDCGRNRKSIAANDPGGLGTGYSLLLAASIRERHSDRDYQIYNRGVSGNTVDDLQARWNPDTLALTPAVLSILIGVNDIWHTRMGQYQGTPAKYEAGYRALLEQTRAALPAVRLIVMEPFVLRTGAVSDAWFPEFDGYRAAAKRVATTANATFVPLHDMFQRLARKAPASYWLGDGVHPTIAGHAAIAEQWRARTGL
ncbi:MAG: SGNH/GDSL hydrolase family protein [Gemmatimonadales bacterium]